MELVEYMNGHGYSFLYVSTSASVNKIYVNIRIYQPTNVRFLADEKRS